MPTKITPETHADKYLQKYTSYSFTADRHLAPLVAAELHVALQALTIAFIPKEGGFQMAAVLSPIPGENFYVNREGQWLGGYVPACFRGYPFSLDKDGHLCVDEDSGLMNDAAGERIYTEDGQLNPQVAAIWEFLRKVEEDRKATELSIRALADAGLMKEWPLKIKMDEEEIQVPDLYRIDDLKLNNLDDETFLKLRRSRSLPVAYAQLFSMPNTSHFAKLAKIRSEESRELKEDDMARILEQDGLIRFD